MSGVESGGESVEYIATFTQRMRAVLIDAAVVAGAFAVLILAAMIAEPIPGSGRVATVLFVAVGWLYEPVLVWRRGATIGHRVKNIRVVARSGGNPRFWLAFVRFAIKIVLGLPSFITMLFTRRHQALHDLLTGTSVQLRDPVREPTEEWYEVRSVRLESRPPV